jgi:hypothetical protein
MRIFPFALIAVGVFGLLKHLGLIDPAFLHLFWPLLLIGIGAAMLARGPRWRSDMRERMEDRWERRMQRHFGPGWANLSEEERERFRAGMRQWRCHGGPGAGEAPSAPTSPPAAAQASTQTPAAGEPR